MIHVCFVLHDASGHYSKFAGMTMLSIFENSVTPPPISSITVHILHDNTLTKDNRDKFNWLAGQYNQHVKFYNVEELCADKIAEMAKFADSFSDKDRSRAADGYFYKLLIPQIIPAKIKKIIYLDADIIVNMDIGMLYRINIGFAPLGAVTEFSNGVKGFLVCAEKILETENYFNSGVLLMNLERLRLEEKTILRGLKFKSENPQYAQFDQLIFNYCFSTQAFKLPLKFNRFVGCARKSKETVNKETIYHFAGKCYGFNLSDPFNRLWLSYFVKTPWFDSSTFCNLFNDLNDMSKKQGQEQKSSLIKLSVAMSGKTRVFVVNNESDFKWLRKAYFVQDGDEIFLCENDRSKQRLIDKMNAERDKKIFFIRVRELIENLKNAGFVEDTDFFNHFEAFPQRLFTSQSLYSVIKTM